MMQIHRWCWLVLFLAVAGCGTGDDDVIDCDGGAATRDGGEAHDAGFGDGPRRLRTSRRGSRAAVG